MIEAMENYLKKNHLILDKEKYFLASEIGIDVGNKCSNLSGVISDGNTHTPYLICDNYESEVLKNNFNPNFSLIGKSVLLHPLDLPYYDLGYESTDSISVIGDVSNEEGVYNLYYTSDSGYVIRRKVIVLDNQALYNDYPKITLNGDEVVYVVRNNEYQDKGVIAIDNIDGDITNNVLIKGEVDTNKVGSYDLYYQVKNSRNNISIIKRRVEVVSEISDLMVSYSLSPKERTSTVVSITFNVLGNLSYAVMPDTTKRVGNDFTYEVSKNGLYNFIFYDNLMRKYEKSVEVSNISDKVLTGTCHATLYPGYVSVEVKSSNNIMSYEYLADDKSYGIFDKNVYQIDVHRPKTVTVFVNDSIGNKGTIYCSMSSKITNAITKSRKQGNFKIIKEYNSSTLKYWIESGMHYSNSGNSASIDVAHIWVDNAYRQFEVALSPVFGERAQGYTILNNAVSSKKYQNKGLVATNGGFFDIDGTSRWRYTTQIPYIINNGKVIRDDTGASSFPVNYVTYGLKKDGQFTTYLFRDGDVAYNKKVKARIDNDKVLYTFGCSGAIVERNRSVSTGTILANRVALGQIDYNNFVLVMTSSMALSDLALFMRDNLGVNYALNLDGGGSRKMYYKDNTNNITTVLSGSRTIAEIVYFVEK